MSYDDASFRAGLAVGRMLWKPPTKTFPIIRSGVLLPITEYTGEALMADGLDVGYRLDPSDRYYMSTNRKWVYGARVNQLPIAVSLHSDGNAQVYTVSDGLGQASMVYYPGADAYYATSGYWYIWTTNDALPNYSSIDEAVSTIAAELHQKFG